MVETNAKEVSSSDYKSESNLPSKTPPSTPGVAPAPPPAGAPGPPPMQWLDWNDDAFARARERHAPVLLFIKASWCRWCRELEERILSTPAVRAALERDYVTILVDKDRRPDIAPRYTRGGWPTPTVGPCGSACRGRMSSGAGPSAHCQNGSSRPSTGRP